MKTKTFDFISNISIAIVVFFVCMCIASTLIDSPSERIHKAKEAGQTSIIIRGEVIDLTKRTN